MYSPDFGFVETIRGYKKIRGKYEDRRGFHPPCPTPIKIFFGQGFGEGSLNSEYWGISLSQPGRNSGGAEPRECR
jgi:hypothetical protein